MAKVFGQGCGLAKPYQAFLIRKDCKASENAALLAPRETSVVSLLGNIRYGSGRRSRNIPCVLKWQ